MKYLKWTGVSAGVLLIISCFLPWYYLGWNNFTITGVDAGDKFGKPAYWHFVFAFFYLLFSFIPRIWAKQWNVFIAAINSAWTIRNFFALAMCSVGNCPQRLTGIWLLLVASLLMMAAALFPDIRVPKEKSK